MNEQNKINVDETVENEDSVVSEETQADETPTPIKAHIDKKLRILTWCILQSAHCLCL